jgi:hypothetical protein
MHTWVSYILKLSIDWNIFEDSKKCFKNFVLPLLEIISTKLNKSVWQIYELTYLNIPNTK